MTERWLLADLGGTNTRVGLAEKGTFLPPSTRSYVNRDFDGLASLLANYVLETETGPISAVCAGVAGPVRENTAQLTNFKWFIEAGALCEATGASRAFLVNDLQAQGYALNDLSDKNLQPLFPGKAVALGPRLVLGLGTGCNVAVVHQSGADLNVPASESGHTSLPHQDGRLGDLISHLGLSNPHRPIECALSGPGLENIYAWITGHHRPAEKIMADPLDQFSSRAISMFCRLLGQVAGDFALSHLPTGGLFMIGGIARAMAPHLVKSDFYNMFCAKGPYEKIMRDIPISLIRDDHAALYGCAHFLRQQTF